MKILLIAAALLFHSTNSLGDWNVNASLGTAGNSFDGHGDIAYSLGAGYPLLQIMNNSLIAIGGWTHTKDEDFYTLGLQLERHLTGPVSGYVMAGGQYNDVDGERTREICDRFEGTWFVIENCDDVTTDKSESDTSYFAGIGLAGEVNDQLDVIVQAVFMDVDSDFDKASNDSVITAGLRFWF